jgi:hypothetical protein
MVSELRDVIFTTTVTSMQVKKLGVGVSSPEKHQPRSLPGNGSGKGSKAKALHPLQRERAQLLRLFQLVYDHRQLQPDIADKLVTPSLERPRSVAKLKVRDTARIGILEGLRPPLRNHI